MSTGLSVAVVTSTTKLALGSSISSTRGIPPISWRRAARTPVAYAAVRPLLRIVRGLVLGLISLVVLAAMASFAFNLATSGEGKPVRTLWPGRFVEADGMLTAFRQWGTRGTPVVLIGGFLEPSFVWNDVGPLLARQHRVYALDLDGFGYSERRGPWTLTEWGNQVQSFMHTLDIRRPIVVGHSLGAAVAVETAHRGLASRIVLLDGDAQNSGGPPWFIQNVLAHTPFVTTGLRLATRWDWPVKRLLANAYGPRHPHLDHAVVRRWTKQLEAKGADHALQTLAGRKLPGVRRAVLRSLQVPATVVWGAQDSVDDPNAGRQTARDLRAPFVVIPDAGHLSMLSRPAAVARAVEDRP
jgi:pimeloyl-ACP methyl ester carboxylesterase